MNAHLRNVLPRQDVVVVVLGLALLDVVLDRAVTDVVLKLAPGILDLGTGWRNDFCTVCYLGAPLLCSRSFLVFFLERPLAPST